MHPIRSAAFVVALATCLAGPAALRADEEKVSLDKLPAAVSAAVKKRFPDAKVVSAAKETEDGKTEYEVVIRDGRTKADVTVDPAGTITAIEKEIAVADLPKAVRAALDGKYSGATYKLAEEVIKIKGGKEALEYYEVVLEKADKKKVEVQVGPDGHIKKEENK